MPNIKRILEIDVEVYRFVKHYKLTHDGNSPSYQEIINGTEVKSKSHLFSILAKLEIGNYIRVNGVRQIEIYGGHYHTDPYYSIILGEGLE